MAFITGSEYITIANKISDARDALLGTVDDIFDTVYEIVQFGSRDKELDVLAPFFNVYQIASGNYKSTTTLNAAIRAINNHVLRRSSYDDMDDFLSSEGVQITQTYADMSNALGYSISAANIL